MIELHPTAMAVGGDAIARDADGRVVFVAGALPGETVVAEVVDEKKDFLRAATIDVVDPSPDRIAPPCANVALGCGGCGWQHIAVGAQRRLKVDMLRDALVRIAKVQADELPAFETVSLAETAFRTTVRVAVRDRRAMFHAAASSDLVSAASCLVAHPLVAELIDDGDFGDAGEAVIRAGVVSGERAVWLRPDGAAGARLPADVWVGPDAVVHEEVNGRLLQASIRSFFQASPDAAAALVRAVLAALPPNVERVADLYAGVGMFAAAIAHATGARVTAVERERSSIADARVNLRGARARIVRAEVGAWRPDGRYDAVVADPARPGLGRPGVAAVVAAAPSTIVLVSCDAASFARDVRLLGDQGFSLRAATLVDAFPQTPHVEVVSRLTPV